MASAFETHSLKRRKVLSLCFSPWLGMINCCDCGVRESVLVQPGANSGCEMNIR